MAISMWNRQVLVLVPVAAAACAPLREPKDLTSRHLVAAAANTIERFRANSEFQPFAHFLTDARAAVVLPNVSKAGFFAGGEGGNGVLIARTAAGSWGQPAFYTLGAASFGLQFGVQNTAVVLIVRNDGALSLIMEHQGKLGADTGATIGVHGMDMEASTTTHHGADILAFANPNIGAYLGATLEGAVLALRNDLNHAFYGGGATLDGIIAGKFRNPAANQLRTVLDGG
ncbi:MAG: hypothetical protein CFH05_01686 [Alphaproteobacteria bacterium MarineAlpha3_Bin4]|nr:MAG: hypothetical protein CFH05_01686 [Alphaproteobacteria bacterium MarineAlpha3_Bin4]